MRIVVHIRQARWVPYYCAALVLFARTFHTEIDADKLARLMTRHMRIRYEWVD